MTLAPGASVTVEDELADRLVEAHRSLNVPAPLEIAYLPMLLHEPGAPATPEDATIARAKAQGATEVPKGTRIVHRGSGAVVDDLLVRRTNG